MTVEKKLGWQLAIATLIIIIGLGLLIAGFCCPPTAVIDSSVLVAFGETSTFAGSILGLDYNYKIKTYHKNDIGKTDK